MSDPLDRIFRRVSIWLGIELDDDVLNALDVQERLARYHRSRMQAPSAPTPPGRPDYDLAPRAPSRDINPPRS